MKTIIDFTYASSLFSLKNLNGDGAEAACRNNNTRIVAFFIRALDSISLSTFTTILRELPVVIQP
jgi:hypothetical protein